MSAEILLTNDEAKLVARALRFVIDSFPFANEDFDGIEVNRLEDIDYDIRKQVLS